MHFFLIWYRLPPHRKATVISATTCLFSTLTCKEVLLLAGNMNTTTPKYGASLCTRCDQKVPRLIFLLGCGYTSGHPCLQGGVLELPLSLGQGMVAAPLSVVCEFRSKRVVYLCLVILSATEGMALVCSNKHK
jgi:hypothetical protein